MSTMIDPYEIKYDNVAGKINLTGSILGMNINAEHEFIDEFSKNQEARHAFLDALNGAFRGKPKEAMVEFCTKCISVFNLNKEASVDSKYWSIVDSIRESRGKDVSRDDISRELGNVIGKYIDMETAKAEFEKVKKAICDDCDAFKKDVRDDRGEPVKQPDGTNLKRFDAFDQLASFIKDSFTADRYPSLDSLSDAQLKVHVKKYCGGTDDINKRSELEVLYFNDKQAIAKDFLLKVNAYDGGINKDLAFKCNGEAYDTDGHVWTSNNRGYYTHRDNLNGDSRGRIYLNSELLKEPAELMLVLVHENTHSHQEDCIRHPNYCRFDASFSAREDKTLQLKKIKGSFETTEENKRLDSSMVDYFTSNEGKVRDGIVDIKHLVRFCEYRAQYCEMQANINAERICTYASELTKNPAFENTIETSRRKNNKAYRELMEEVIPDQKEAFIEARDAERKKGAGLIKSILGFRSGYSDPAFDKATKELLEKNGLEPPDYEKYLTYRGKEINKNPSLYGEDVDKGTDKGIHSTNIADSQGEQIA